MLQQLILTSIRAFPEPTIFIIFYSFQEIFANDVGCCLGVTSLAKNNFFQLLLIPFVHGIYINSLIIIQSCCIVQSRFLLTLLLLLSRIGIQIFLHAFTCNVKIMREFTLVALFTMTRLEELAQDSFRVSTKWNLLGSLNRLEKLKKLLLLLKFSSLLSILGFFQFLLLSLTQNSEQRYHYK
jgi:hypothetical protein